MNSTASGHSEATQSLLVLVDFELGSLDLAQVALVLLSAEVQLRPLPFAQLDEVRLRSLFRDQDLRHQVVEVLLDTGEPLQLGGLELEEAFVELGGLTFYNILTVNDLRLHLGDFFVDLGD